MTIDEAIINAVKEGYHVRVFDGIKMYYSGANTEWSVWTRTDNDSSFMVPVEAIFLDPLFWQALGRALRWDRAQLLVRGQGQIEQGLKASVDPGEPEMHEVVETVLT